MPEKFDLKEFYKQKNGRFRFCPAEGCEFLTKIERLTNNPDSPEWNYCENCVKNYLEEEDLPVFDRAAIFERVNRKWRMPSQ